MCIYTHGPRQGDAARLIAEQRRDPLIGPGDNATATWREDGPVIIRRACRQRYAPSKADKGELARLACNTVAAVVVPYEVAPAVETPPCTYQGSKVRGGGLGFSVYGSVFSVYGSVFSVYGV